MEKSSMNKRETALFLGIGLSTLEKLLKEKSLPHMKVGRRLIFKTSVIESWLENQMTIGGKK